MPYTESNYTNVEGEVLVERRWQKKKGLFGLIEWKKLLSEKEIGERLNIKTCKPPKEIMGLN